MRTLLATVLLGLALPASAQSDPEAAEAPPPTAAETDPEAVYPIARGTRILGGSAHFLRLNRTTVADVSPRLGVFVADGIALSAVVRLGLYRSTFDEVSLGDDLEALRGEFSNTQIDLGLGPEIRYYVGGEGARAFPFVGGDVQLAYTIFDRDIGSASFDDTDFRMTGGFEVGVMVPLARNVALTGQAFARVTDLFQGSDFQPDGYYGLSAGFTTFIY